MKQTNQQIFLVEVDAVCELWNKDKLTDEEATNRILQLVAKYNLEEAA